MGTHRDDTNAGRTVPWRYIYALLGIACVIGVVVYVVRQPPQALADILQTSITISICGNGQVDPGEACDDGIGNNVGSYGSTTAQRVCLPDCSGYGPYCGDGVLQVRFNEQCDEGTANGPTSLCSATCVSQPAVPASSPPQVLGNIPSRSDVSPGVISAAAQTQVVLRGKAYPNSDVHILLDGVAASIVRADSNADFLYSTTDVTPGTATFSFWANDSGGATSVTTSVVFDIVQSAVTSVNNIFLPPTLSVSARQIAPGGLLTVSGQSVPSATVIINLDKDTSDALAAAVDHSGTWALQLDTSSITQGFHSAKASFELASSSRSGFGKSVNFFVGNQLPKGGPSPDMNGDGKVNLVDFSIFLLSWGTHDVRADFNEDGTVNLADFSIMLFNWTG